MHRVLTEEQTMALQRIICETVDTFFYEMDIIHKYTTVIHNDEYDDINAVKVEFQYNGRHNKWYYPVQEGDRIADVIAEIFSDISREIKNEI